MKTKNKKKNKQKQNNFKNIHSDAQHSPLPMASHHGYGIFAIKGYTSTKKPQDQMPNWLIICSKQRRNTSDPDVFLQQQGIYTKYYTRSFNLFLPTPPPFALQLGKALPHIIHGHFKELVGQIAVVLRLTGCRVQVVDERLPLHRLQAQSNMSIIVSTIRGGNTKTLKTGAVEWDYRAKSTSKNSSPSSILCCCALVVALHWKEHNRSSFTHYWSGQDFKFSTVSKKIKNKFLKTTNNIEKRH